MALIVTGTALGQPARLVWEAGEISGDEIGQVAVRDLLRREVELGLDPVGPFFEAGLDEAWRAAQTMAAALQPATLVATAGEQLEVPGQAIPPGALA